MAVLSWLLPDRPYLGNRPFWVLLNVFVVLSLVARAERRWPDPVSRFRDFLPLGLTLVAFEELQFFAPRWFDMRHERIWIGWDHLVLYDWHLRGAIEGLGPVIPVYLELCYLLVYAVGTFCVIVLYLRHRRAEIDRFFVILLTGTLLAYGLIPYFPSEPPRILFAGMDDPGITTWIRQLNLFILRKATIHVGVFPSAHVSSAFAAAWAMFLLIPERKTYGWGLVVYAISVSVATIYGRYHYAADVVAGFGVSMVAAAVALWTRRLKEVDFARLQR
jgi:membrane-associated phospholipid phosphatase